MKLQWSHDFSVMETQSQTKKHRWHGYASMEP